MTESNSSWTKEVKDRIKKRYSFQASKGGLHANAKEKMVESGYSQKMIDLLPNDLVEAFSGCGCPLHGLEFGGQEVIVDLGAGAGIDSYIASTHLNTGKVISIDLTPEMLMPVYKYTKIQPISILSGDIERLPLRDCVADIVISNASFNLTINRLLAYKETMRITKPGGIISIYDIFLEESLPKEIFEDPLAHTTSLGGVCSEESAYQELEKAGFIDVNIENHSKFGVVTAALIRGKRRL